MNIKIILLLLFIINFSVSFLVATRDDLEIKQKFYQIIFIWLFPVVGAFSLFFFYKTQDAEIKSNLSEFGGGTSGGIGASPEGGDGG